jgi:hypothetical protein
MSLLVSDLLNHHLNEFLRCQVKGSSKRVLTAICIGFTALQGHPYAKSSEYAHSLCGLIETGLSLECLSKVDLVMQFMSNDFVVESALSDTPFSSYYANNVSSLPHTHFMSGLEDLLMIHDVEHPRALIYN